MSIGGRRPRPAGAPAPAPAPAAVEGPDLRLVGVAAAAWTGVLAGSLLAASRGVPASAGLLTGPGHLPLDVAGAVLVIALAGLSTGRRHRSGRFPTGLAWLLVALAGLGCGLVKGAADRTNPLAVLAGTATTVRVVGEIGAVPTPVRGGFGAPGAVLVRLRVHRLERVRAGPGGPLVDVAVDGLVSVRATRDWSEVPVGGHVTALVRLGPAPAGRGVQAWGQAVGGPGPVSGPDRLHRVVDRFRDGLLQACRRLPQPARGLIPAVVDGDTRLVDTATTSDMRVTGLLHLSAVSGANVAVVLAATTGLLGALRRGRVTTAVLALGVLGGFVLIADSAPSVLRAGVTAALGLFGARRGGAGTGLRLLASSATLLVLVEPDLTRDAGFGLSVCATAAILLGSGRFTEALQTWLPAPLAAAVGVSVAAQLGAQPVLGLLSGQLSVVGPVANVLAAPAVPPVTLLGLLAALLAPIWPAGASVVAAGAVPGAWWLAQLAHTCARLPGAAIAWPPGATGAALALGLAGAGFWAGPRIARHRMATLPMVGVLLGLLAGPVVLRR